MSHERPTFTRKHFCQIRVRGSRQTLAEYTIDAPDWYYARHNAADKFRLEHPEEKRDWYVDSITMD